MKRRIFYVFAVALSTVIFCATIGEGFGQQTYNAEVKLGKEGKYYGLKGFIEVEPLELKLKAFAGVNAKDAITGAPIDLYTRADLAVMGTAFFCFKSKIYDLFGKRQAEGSFDGTIKLYERGLFRAQFSSSYKWDRYGNDYGPLTTLSLTLGNTLNLEGTTDWKKQDTKITLSIGLRFSPDYKQEVSGTITYGNGTFTGTISGTIITPVEMPSLSIDASGNYSIDEVDHSKLTLTETQQISYTVGGILVPVDKFGLLAPYIGLASTTMIGAVATAVYVKRVKRRKER